MKEKQIILNQKDIRAIRLSQWLLVFLGMSIYQQASADVVGTISTMFANGSDSFMAIITLVRGVAFVAGLIIGGAALFKLKEVNDGRATIKTPIVWAMISAALISIPASMATIAMTLTNKGYHGAGLLSDVQDTSGIPGVAEALTGVLIFVQLLGHIAFFRGLLLLKDAGAGKDGTLGRGLTHLFGGAAAINIQTTVGILARTFFKGVTMPMGIGSW